MTSELDSRFCDIVQTAGLDYESLDKKIDSKNQSMWFSIRKGRLIIWVNVTLEGTFYLYKVNKCYPYAVAEMYALRNTIWSIKYKYPFSEAIERM